MRSIVKVGVAVGAAGCVVLAVFGHLLGLLVAPGVALVGLLAGLGAAKALDRAWYGRQFRAGLFTGICAVTLAALGALAALFAENPHNVAALAATVPASARGLVRAFSFATWAGVDILAVVLASVVGIGLAGIVAQFGALSKNVRAVRVVDEARQAALPLSRPEVWGPSVASGAVPIMAGNTGGLWAAPQSGFLGGVGGGIGGHAHPSTPAYGHPYVDGSGYAHMSGGPMPSGMAQQPAAPLPNPVLPQQQSAEFAQTTPEMAAAPTQPAPSVSRTPSDARRTEGQLTDEMREALAVWAQENPPTKKTREPKKSAFLNEKSTPPKKGARKKQDTQDWLC